jgi:hypothetical protein
MSLFSRMVSNMLGLFKRKPAVDVEECLELVVAEFGIYIKNGDTFAVREGFALLNKVFPHCEEHVQLQLAPIMKKYDSLLNGIGVYEGFILTSVQVINYCLIHIRLSSLSME